MMQILASPLLLGRLQNVRSARWEGEYGKLISNDKTPSSGNIPHAQEGWTRRGTGLL